MANRDGIGAALERASQNLLNTIITGIQLQQQRQRIGLETERIQIAQEELGLEKRRVDESARVRQVNELLAFSRFMPAGMTINQAPPFKRMLSDLTSPEMADAMGSTIVRELPLSTFLQREAQKYFNTLLPESQELMRSGLIGLLMNGQFRGIEGFSMDKALEQLDATTLRTMYEATLNDPTGKATDMMQDFQLQRLGVPRNGWFSIPGTGPEPLRLSYEVAGRLGITLHGQQLSREVAYSQMDVNMADTWSRIMLESGLQIAPQRVLEIDSQFARGDPSWTNYKNSLPPESPIRAAAEYFEMANRMTGDMELDLLRSYGPVGEAYALKLQLQYLIEKTGIPAEEKVKQMAEMMDDLTTYSVAAVMQAHPELAGLEVEDRPWKFPAQKTVRYRGGARLDQPYDVWIPTVGGGWQRYAVPGRVAQPFRRFLQGVQEAVTGEVIPQAGEQIPQAGEQIPPADTLQQQSTGPGPIRPGVEMSGVQQAIRDTILEGMRSRALQYPITGGDEDIAVTAAEELSEERVFQRMVDLASEQEARRLHQQGFMPVPAPDTLRPIEPPAVPVQPRMRRAPIMRPPR